MQGKLVAYTLRTHTESETQGCNARKVISEVYTSFVL